MNIIKRTFIDVKELCKNKNGRKRRIIKLEKENNMSFLTIN